MIIDARPGTILEPGLLRIGLKHDGRFRDEDTNPHPTALSARPPHQETFIWAKRAGLVNFRHTHSGFGNQARSQAAEAESSKPGMNDVRGTSRVEAIPPGAWSGVAPQGHVLQRPGAPVDQRGQQDGPTGAGGERFDHPSGARLSPSPRQ